MSRRQINSYEGIKLRRRVSSIWDETETPRRAPDVAGKCER